MNNKKRIALLPVFLCLCILAGCNSEDTRNAPAESVRSDEVTYSSEKATTGETDMKKNTLSGIIPDELEYIPDSYTQAAEQQGVLEKLTYDTWESFTYEQYSQKLTKEVWVYLPYGYSSVNHCKT